MKESNIQRLIQLESSERDILLMRNNVGQYTTNQGHVIKYGVGGTYWPDLIGITPVTITADMVGRTIGVFTGVEVKTNKGRPAQGQIQVIDAIRARYAIAGIARSTDDVLELIEKFKR